MEQNAIQDLKVKNWELFKKKLSEVGVDITTLAEKYGNLLSEGTYTFSNKDNTACGEGKLLNIILRTLTPMAININKMLPEEKQVDKNSLVKVCLLSQISKAIMVSPNTNQWEIENRGLIYKFNETQCALKMGMRSVAMCMESGIVLTETELEAISNLDREEDKQTKYFSSTLSIILKQAIELTDIVNKNGERVKE